jgi:hypothetical protein
LKVYLEKEPLDILSINESRLDETISSDIVGIPGYDIIITRSYYRKEVLPYDQSAGDF